MNKRISPAAYWFECRIGLLITAIAALSLLFFSAWYRPLSERHLSIKQEIGKMENQILIIEGVIKKANSLEKSIALLRAEEETSRQRMKALPEIQMVSLLTGTANRFNARLNGIQPLPQEESYPHDGYRYKKAPFIVRMEGSWSSLLGYMAALLRMPDLYVHIEQIQLKKKYRFSDVIQAQLVFSHYYIVE